MQPGRAADALPIESIRRLDLRPGDTAILTLNAPITPEQATRIREQWLAEFADTKLVILNDGLELTVLTDEQRDELLRRWNEPHT